MRDRLDRPPVVYFIRYQDRIKIGFTKSLEDRLKTFRATLLGGMELIGTINGGKTRERSLHAHFRSYHIDGEWFRDVPDVRSAISELIKHDPPAPRPQPVAYICDEQVASDALDANAEHEAFCKRLEVFNEAVMAEPRLIAAWVDLKKPLPANLTEEHKVMFRDEFNAVKDMASVAMLTFDRKDFDPDEALTRVRDRAARAIKRIDGVLAVLLSERSAA